MRHSLGEGNCLCSSNSGGPSLAFVYQVCITFGRLSSRFFAEFSPNGKTWGQEGSGMKKKKKTLKFKMRILAGLHCRSQQTGCGSTRGWKTCGESSGGSKCACLVSYQNPSRKPLKSDGTLRPPASPSHAKTELKGMCRGSHSGRDAEGSR